MILWADTETTGLNPLQDHLLEVAFILTDNNLRELQSIQVVIKPSNWDLLKRVNFKGYLDPVVIEMHTKSGLIDLVDGGMSILEAQHELHQWILGVGAQNMPLAGSTIGFDRKFLDHHMPNLHAELHYRSIDVSTLKELARVWSPDDVIEGAGKKAHRATSDIRDSIEELRQYRERLFRDEHQGVA